MDPAGRVLKAASFCHADGQPIYMIVPPPVNPGTCQGTNQTIANIQVMEAGDVNMAPPDPIPYPQEYPTSATPSGAPPSRDKVIPPSCPHPPPPPPPVPPAPPAMSGRVYTLLRGLEQGFDALIVQPVQEFHTTYVANQERLRNLKVTAPAALDHAADEIAEEVNAKYSVTPKTLRGVV